MSFKDFTDTEGKIQYQLHESSKNILTLQEQMEALQEVIQKHTIQVAEISELYYNIKALLKILTILETVAKWFITIGAGFTVVWAVWKYLIVETIKETIGRIPK